MLTTYKSPLAVIMLHIKLLKLSPTLAHNICVVFAALHAYIIRLWEGGAVINSTLGLLCGVLDSPLKFMVTLGGVWGLR